MDRGEADIDDEEVDRRQQAAVEQHDERKPASCVRQGSGRRYGWHGAFLSGGDNEKLSSCRAGMPQEPAAKVGRMTGDPAGHYERLEVDPAAAPRRSWRRSAARRVFCTRTFRIPATPTAFMPDEAGLRGARRRPPPRRLRPRCSRAAGSRTAGRQIAVPPPRGPRLSDLPVACGRLSAACVCLAAIDGLCSSSAPSPPQGRRPAIRPVGATAGQAAADTSACRRERPDHALRLGRGAVTRFCGSTMPTRDALLCRAGTLPPSARCGRCVWSRSTD